HIPCQLDGRASLAHPKLTSMEEITVLFELSNIENRNADVTTLQALGHSGDMLVVQTADDQRGRGQARSSRSAARSSSWSRSSVSLESVRWVSPAATPSAAGAESTS